MMGIRRQGTPLWRGYPGAAARASLHVATVRAHAAVVRSTSCMQVGQG
jgi:hypothetical protein